MNIDYNNPNQSVEFFRNVEEGIFVKAEKDLSEKGELCPTRGFRIGVAMGTLLLCERVSHLAETFFKAFHHLFQGNNDKACELFNESIVNIVLAITSPAVLIADTIAYTVLFAKDPEYAVSLKDEIIDENRQSNSLAFTLLNKVIESALIN